LRFARQGRTSKLRPVFACGETRRQRVLVELVVDVPPLPSALPLDVVAVFVTGAPVPVSVAVVPVEVGWSVSVEPVVVSAGLRLHAVQRRRMPMMATTPRMRIDDPPRPCGAIVAPGLARDVNAIAPEVQYG
jgi:hypothetical protein